MNRKKIERIDIDTNNIDKAISQLQEAKVTALLQGGDPTIEIDDDYEEGYSISAVWWREKSAEELSDESKARLKHREDRVNYFKRQLELAEQDLNKHV